MPSEIPNIQAKGFRSGLFGFDKDDVLAYMNALADEAQQNDLTYQEKIRDLEAQVDKLKKDQANARACVEKLQDEYNEANERAENAEKQAVGNAQKTVMAVQQVNGFRSQCAERDKAIELLQADKDKLQKQVDALIEHQNQEKADREAEKASIQQQAAETAKALQAAQAAQAAAQAQAAQAVQEKQANAPIPVAPAFDGGENARIQARKILEDARLYAENAEAALAREAEEQKARMAENARGIAAGVLLLRERLGRVDEKLNAATLNLENATGAIYRALDATMTDLDTLGSRMHDYADGTPETDTPAGAVPPPPVQPAPVQPGPAQAPAPQPRAAQPVTPRTPVPAAPKPAANRRTATLRPKRQAAQAKHRLRSAPYGRRSVSQSLLDAMNRMDDDQ